MPPKLSTTRPTDKIVNFLSDRAKSILNIDEGISGFREYKDVPVVEFQDESAWNKYISSVSGTGAMGSIGEYSTQKMDQNVRESTPFIAIPGFNRPLRGADPLTNELIFEHEYSHLGRSTANKLKSLEGSYHNRAEEVQAFTDQYKHLEGLRGSKLTPQAVTRLQYGDKSIYGEAQYNKSLDPGAPFTQAARNARMLDMEFYNKPTDIKAMEGTRMNLLGDYIRDWKLWSRTGLNKPSQDKMIEGNQAYLGMKSFHKNVSSQFGNI